MSRNLGCTGRHQAEAGPDRWAGEVHTPHARPGGAMCRRGFCAAALWVVCATAWAQALMPRADAEASEAAGITLCSSCPDSGMSGGHRFPWSNPPQLMSDQTPSSPGGELQDRCWNRYIEDSKICDQAKEHHGKRAAAVCRNSATARYAACLKGKPLPPLTWWPGPDGLDPPVTPAAEFAWCVWIPILCPESPAEGGPRPGHRPGLPPSGPILPPLLPPVPVPVP